MNIKVLGVGCAACRSMVSEVERLITWLKLDTLEEYVADVEKIISDSVMSIPVLVIDEQIVMIGHRGAAQIEQALRERNAA